MRNLKMVSNERYGESELMRKIASGDEAAFGKIMSDYRDMVLRLASNILDGSARSKESRGGCRDVANDAEDIAQETFMRVWQRAGSYCPDYSAATWIRTIACRLCLDKLRKDRFLKFFSRGKFPEPEPQATTEKAVENEETKKAVGLATERLPPKQRIVFVLKEVEGLDTEEVRQITGQTPDQIKSNLHLAKSALRVALAAIAVAIVALAVRVTRPVETPSEVQNNTWTSVRRADKPAARKLYDGYVRSQKIRKLKTRPGLSEQHCLFLKELKDKTL